MKCNRPGFLRKLGSEEGRLLTPMDWRGASLLNAPLPVAANHLLKLQIILDIPTEVLGIACGTLIVLWSVLNLYLSKVKSYVLG